ncbi:Gfo/Idh/MocA family oxidoreductase, partial [Halorubrum sp. SS7]
GAHHARVYAGSSAVDLVGVADDDWDRAKEIAEKHGTRALNRGTLLQAVDAVSVVVPTQFHASVVREALEADTHVLVEKPFVDDIATGRELISLADRKDLRLQVGHIERFNPAVRAL